VDRIGKMIKMILHFSLCRVIIAFALLTVTAVWVVTLVRVEYEYQEALRSTMRSNENMAMAFEKHIWYYLDNIDEMLVFLKLQYEKAGVINNTIRERIIAAQSIQVMQILVVDSNGKIEASLLINTEARDVSEQEYFQFHKNTDIGQVHVSKPTIDSITGRDVFYLSRRINNPDGKFGGVVVCGIEFRYFSEFYHEVIVGHSYSIAIIGTDGLVRIRQTASGMESGQDVSTSENFRRMKIGHAGSFIGTSVFDHQSRLFSYHNLDRYPLIVQVSVQKEEALAGFREREEKYFNIAIASSGIILLVYGLLLFMILKQEQVSAARRESEERFAGAFDHAPIGMALISPEDQILKVNEWLCHMLGYEEKELLARTVQDVAYPEDVNINAELRSQMLSGATETYCIEKRYCHKSGRVISCLLTTSLVRDNHKKPLYFVNQVEDITERKQAAYKSMVEKRRLRAVLQIAQMRTMSSKELLNHMMNAAIELSDSKFGYLYFYSEETEEFTLHTWSQAVMDVCIIADKNTQYHLGKTGLWGEAVRQRRPIIDNDYAAPSPLKKGYPDGHAPLKRFMTLPVFIDGKIVAVAGVANKEDVYTDLDVNQLILMMDSLWNIFERRQAEDELRNVNENLDRKVKERTQALDTANEKLTEQNAELEAMNEELEALNEELQRLTLVDGLTGIANRRYFDEYLEREWRTGQRQQKSMSLIMADIDFFKLYNDTYGHQSGDDCLKVIARVLKGNSKRTTDLAARYGGEEFAVVLPDTDCIGAMIVAEEIRQCVEDLQIENRETPIGRVTISLGVAFLTPSQGESSATLVSLADKALYQAKHAGRNRVVMGQE